MVKGDILCKIDIQLWGTHLEKKESGRSLSVATSFVPEMLLFAHFIGEGFMDKTGTEDNLLDSGKIRHMAHDKFAKSIFWHTPSPSDKSNHSPESTTVRKTVRL